MTKAEKTRQFIIEQTAPIFNTKGVAATSINDIMEATKLAKGSLYVHFENKEELSYYAVDYNLKDFIALQTYHVVLKIMDPIPFSGEGARSPNDLSVYITFAFWLFLLLYSIPNMNTIGISVFSFIWYYRSFHM